MNKEELTTASRYVDSNLKSVFSKRPPAKALIIDLSEKTSYDYDIPQAYLEKYAGGPALGSRLWADFAGYSVDDPSCMETENPVVIVPSIIGNSKMPYGNLTSVVFRSPVTENLSFNSFSSSLSVSPFAAAVIIGRADRKCVISFNGNSCDFSDAENLVNKDTSEINSVYPSSIICSRAGDNKVLYSTCIYEGKTTGRGGLGYVFASKNLKAVSLKKVNQEDSSDYGKITRKIAKSPAFKNTDSFIVRVANDSGWAPVNNFSLRYDPRLFHLSTSKTSKPLPYEVRLILGCNCNTFDIKKVQKRYEFCIENGLDPVSAGNILGCNNIYEQEQVMGCLSMMVKNSAAEKVAEYSINNLECGPYDYRGIHAQALSDSIGNSFPVYFAFKDEFSPKECAKLVSFNEMLVLGLQSLGVNHEVIYPLMVENTNPLFFLRFAYSNRLIASSIKNACKSDVSFNTVLKIGENCRTLVREINSKLKIANPAIPDFFCIEPKSNHESETVVPFRSMLVTYGKQNL